SLVHRLAVSRIVLGPGPACGLVPHLADPELEQLEVASAGPADTPCPCFRVDPVRSLLLKDLARALGQRLDRAAAGGGYERGEDPVDDEVRRDEREPVG